MIIYIIAETQEQTDALDAIYDAASKAPLLSLRYLHLQSRAYLRVLHSETTRRTDLSYSFSRYRSSADRFRL